MIDIEQKEVIKKLIIESKNSNTAFDKIMNIYSPYIYRLCKRLCINKFDADDLFQNTWLKIYKSIHKYNIENSFENWLYTVCLNNYRDNYTKKKKLLSKVKDLFPTTEAKEEELSNVLDWSQSIDDAIITKFDAVKTREYVNQLKDIYRIPIILFYFKDLSYEDIAEITKKPIGTVKSRLNMAKVKLKKMMEDDDG